MPTEVNRPEVLALLTDDEMARAQSAAILQAAGRDEMITADEAAAMAKYIELAAVTPVPEPEEIEEEF